VEGGSRPVALSRQKACAPKYQQAFSTRGVSPACPDRFRSRARLSRGRGAGWGKLLSSYHAIRGAHLGANHGTSAQLNRSDILTGV
jgi:hypothetical protein